MIVDEAQDLSAAEYALVEKWGRAAGGYVFCGDPRQALYVWRGADPSIFSPERTGAGHRDTLGQSYRVPRILVQASENLAENLSDYFPIDYKPTDLEGEILWASHTWRCPDGLVNIAEEFLSQGKSVMIAGSCSHFVTKTFQNCSHDIYRCHLIINQQYPLRSS